MTHGEGRETRIVRCPACKRYYRLPGTPPAPGTRMRCGKCGEVFAVAAATEAAPAAPAGAAGSGRPRVLVATDGAEFQALIMDVLASAGHELRHAATGDAAWELFGGWRPHVALLDVALPGVPSFEICDRVRADDGLRGIGLILIASVFQQTRYKRAPTSLYGADDYIEKHHIRDWLPEKVVRLLPASAQPAAPAAAPAAGVAGERESLIREELAAAQPKGRAGLPRLQENLRRFARIIVSDIALYNEELVERGIREGTFSELLKKELDEGRRLFQTRAPASSAGERLFEEAVQDFIARRSAGPEAGRRRGRGGS